MLHFEKLEKSRENWTQASKREEIISIIAKHKYNREQKNNKNKKTS